MRHVVLTALLLAACDDSVFLGGGETVTGVEGFEGVAAIVDAHCLGCHSAASALGDLDLETDLYAAIVGVTGAYGEVIVEPGSPGDSIFYRKITADSTVPGVDMPPGSGGLSADETQIVAAWITDGAPEQ
jgi:mono/diheme cytochrome c family protein